MGLTLFNKTTDAIRLCEKVKARHCCERFSVKQFRWVGYGTRDCFGKKRLAMTDKESFYTAWMRRSSLRFISYLIVSILLSAACQSDHDVASNQQDTLDEADQISYNAKLISTVRGKLSSVIIYKRMERHSNKKYVYFYDGVEISLYEEGTFISTIRSDSAELDERTEIMIFSGNVSVKSEDGISLTTSKLQWQEDEARVTSDAFVTVITAENDTINGAGFESEKSFKKWLIHKPYGVTQTTLDLGVR